MFQNEISKDQEKLWKSAEKGDVTEVRRLLSSRMLDLDVTNRHPYKDAPLHLAAINGHKVVVQILL